MLHNLMIIAKASWGACFLIDDGSWVCKATWGQRSFQKQLNALRLPHEALPAGVKALKSRRAFAAAEGADCFGFVKQQTILGEIRSALAVPLSAGSDAMGVCLLGHGFPGCRYTKDELSFFTALGRQAALAVANAKRLGRERAARELADQQVQEMQALYQISLAMSETLELKKLFPRVMQAVTCLDLFKSQKAAKGGFFLIRGAELELLYHTEAEVPGFVEAHCDLKVGQCLCGLAAQTGETVFSDSDLDPLHVLKIPGTSRHGHVSIPLRARGKTMGVMCLYLPPHARIKLRSIRVLRAIGDQLGLAIENARHYEKERRIADTLQASFLPEPLEREELDIGLFYKSSADELGKIGGDFYDFVELEDGEVALVVGDVSGRGLEAATVTSAVKHMLRVFLEENLLPGHMLTRLNQAITKRLDQDKFVTVCLAIIYLELGTISFSSAGHPPPVLISSEGKGRFTLLEQPGTDFPLGVVEGHPFQTLQTPIEDGDLLIMYTDGLIEARSPEGKQFGLQRLIGAAQIRRGLPSQRIAEELIGEAVAHSEGKLKDDIALLVIKFQPGAAGRAIGAHSHPGALGEANL